MRASGGQTPESWGQGRGTQRVLTQRPPAPAALPQTLTVGAPHKGHLEAGACHGNREARGHRSSQPLLASKQPSQTSHCHLDAWEPRRPLQSRAECGDLAISLPQQQKSISLLGS